MSESIVAPDTQPMQSAGAMLRAARQSQGLHIAALATLLKVTPRKLEALEADRHEELQGPTFVRALAQAACRALKVDPSPVLARLPQVNQHTLDQVSGGLNAPFREHGARRDPLELPAIGKGVAGLVGLLLVAAAAMWWLPADWHFPSWRPAAPEGATTAQPAEAAEPAAAIKEPAVPPSEVPASASRSAASSVETLAMPTVNSSDAHTGAVEPGHLLQVRVRSESWVDVTDGGGQSLLSRTLQPGEVVDLDGALPLRVKIGNASGTELSFRGQVLDLASQTRDNVARLELK
jgi:cytoskeleton protein RodZ